MDPIAEPLQAVAFAPFGEVLEAPREPGRAYFNGALGNMRPAAPPSLSIVRVAPVELPLIVTTLERHEFSSQSFVPIEVARWLVLVAPKTSDGGPDGAKLRVFVAGPGQGITLRADTWHYGLTVLDCPARFAIFMWLDGGAGDDEFVALERPVNVRLSSDGCMLQRPDASAAVTARTG